MSSVVVGHQSIGIAAIPLEQTARGCKLGGRESVDDQAHHLSAEKDHPIDDSNALFSMRNAAGKMELNIHHLSIDLTGIF
jgi:hypothetical protein